MKYIFYFSILILVFNIPASFSHAKNPGFLSHKEEMIINGPYGEDIRIIINKKESTLILKADSLGFEKEKIFFMKTGLIKKLTARKIKVELRKKNKPIISFKADKALFSGDIKKISIKNPIILFPSGLKKPDRIIIHVNKQLFLIYGKKTESYNL